jgi:hypothetical protein
MASFGTVLDLLDERYLNLQDVAGNIEPMPTLVPHEHYAQNVHVYRMDTDHEMFIGLIQDYTDRMSRQLGKELWTWCVQWEVDRAGASAPSLKKPRLDNDNSGAAPNGPQTQRRAPTIDIFDRRVIDPELIQEDEMLRCLIDIVQVESTVVPNFIEFLYRWIDFFEGDGKALKAALKWEIPSLWDFDYHPLILPEDYKKRVEAERAELSKEQGQARGHELLGKTNIAQALLQGSPSKRMCEKPDLAAMERQLEESERLQYREVKFGIQPPELKQPFPLLVNIPRDSAKRVKYYAACFKSRQRALALLLEAGITMQQISNYHKLQDMHPRDTPKDGDPKHLKGLRHYHKDAEASQDYYRMREKLQLEREKQKEIAISNKLAFEAQLGAADGLPEGSSGVPLIPPTPSYARRSDMAADMMRRIRAARANGEEKINFVATPLVGKMESKLFEGARDRREMQGPGRSAGIQPHNAQPCRAGHGDVVDSEDEDDSDSGSDESSANDDGPGTGAVLRPSSARSGHPIASVQPHHNSNVAGLSGTAARPLQPPTSPTVLAEYMRNLTPEQAQRLVPMLNPTTRQAVAGIIMTQVASNQVPISVSATTGGAGLGLPLMPPTGMPQYLTTGTNPRPTNLGMATASAQPRSSAMPLPLPTPIRPPTVTVAPGPHLPTIPYLPPPTRPPMFATSSGPLSGVHPPVQYHTSLQPQVRATSFDASSLQSESSPAQRTPSVPNGSGALLHPLQVSGPPQIQPTPSIPQLSHLPPLSTLPRAPNQTGPPIAMAPQLGVHSNFTARPLQQTAYTNTDSGLPPPGYAFNIQHFLALHGQQQQAQAQTAQQQPIAPAHSMMQYTIHQPPIPQNPRGFWGIGG